jgi:hypothetical protein
LQAAQDSLNLPWNYYITDKLPFLSGIAAFARLSEAGVNQYSLRIDQKKLDAQEELIEAIDTMHSVVQGEILASRIESIPEAPEPRPAGE